jgi:hypothetical protein
MEMYFCLLFFLSTALPLALAWRANQQTSLRHVLGWAGLAWFLWSWTLTWADRPAEDTALVRYLACAGTGAAAIGLLGARWPGVRPWHFVVVGYWLVILLPVAQSVFVRSRLQLDYYQLLLPGMAIAVGVINYLPTQLGPAAVLIGTVAGVELLSLTASEGVVDSLRPMLPLSRWLLGAAPWLAYGALHFQPTPASRFDRAWLSFRNRFGFVWAQRLREQFNRSAVHAGWPVVLYWQGLRVARGASQPEPEVQEAMLTTLNGLMKRFGLVVGSE